MSIYYNDIDKKACAWVDELIGLGLVPNGEIDTRSILDVQPGELLPFTQCHFFNGISGWAQALKLAGWENDRPVWCASLPCQPFSTAGKRAGKKDARHLWPVFFNLVEFCKPRVIFGEQVSAAIKMDWLDGVFKDLKSIGYDTAATLLPASIVGAPHIRSRIYWVAVLGGKHEYIAGSVDREGSVGSIPKYSIGRIHSQIQDGKNIGRNGNTEGDSINVKEVQSEGMGHALQFGCTPSVAIARNSELVGGETITKDQTLVGKLENQWTDGSKWALFRDGSYRRVKCDIPLLVDGISDDVVPSGDIGLSEIAQIHKETIEARDMRLKGYGNAIVPPLAAKFIQICKELID
jgi:DNA (cytosine-5)-methyltransferase 1